MRRQIIEYIQHFLECQRYKAQNMKPADLLQTPVYSQRFEVLSIDLFGPLPKTENEYQWILVVEDTASRWVELIAISYCICMSKVLNRGNIPQIWLPRTFT